MKPILILAVLMTILAANFYVVLEYPKTRVSITHDYMYQNAIKMCMSHGGFHYMVHSETIYAERSKGSKGNDFPCLERTKIRCHDEALLDFETGVRFCFISEEQIKETLVEK